MTQNSCHSASHQNLWINETDVLSRSIIFYELIKIAFPTKATPTQGHLSEKGAERSDIGAQKVAIYYRVKGVYQRIKVARCYLLMNNHILWTILALV